MSCFGKKHFGIGNVWRNTCKKQLEMADSTYKANVVNPNDYFNFIDNPPRYETEREIMEFDLHKIRHSDLVIVNFNDVKSLGTMAEIAIAYDRGVPILGLCIGNTDKLHPWQKEMCNRIFNDIDKLIAYVIEFYLT